MIWTLSQVALGGAVGAVARFATVSGVARLAGIDFPFGTMAVNVLGSFVMGALWIWLDMQGLTRLAPLLMAGLLGGFTTFSAFSLDTLRLWESGAAWSAAGYAAGSVVLSIAALVAGATLIRGMAA